MIRIGLIPLGFAKVSFDICNIIHQVEWIEIGVLLAVGVVDISRKFHGVLGYPLAVANFVRNSVKTSFPIGLCPRDWLQGIEIVSL